MRKFIRKSFFVFCTLRSLRSCRWSEAFGATCCTFIIKPSCKQLLILNKHKSMTSHDKTSYWTRMRNIQLQIVSHILNEASVVFDELPRQQAIHKPACLCSQDVGLNTEAVVYQDSSASSPSNSQTKSLGLPHLHRSSRESSHGRCLLSSRQNLRSTQVFSTSSNKHPGKRGQVGVQ